MGLSVKTIYKKINRGEIPHLVEGGKKCVSIEDSEFFNLVEKKREFTQEKGDRIRGQNSPEIIQEAEIIDDSPGDKRYNLVSMENGTFEQLILNITELSEKRAQTYEETIRRLHEEYYETRAENKRLNQELKESSIKQAEAEINAKISQIRVHELENDRVKMGDKISDLEEKLFSLKANQQDLEHEKALLQSQIKELEQTIKILESVNKELNDKATEATKTEQPETKQHWYKKL